jgi:hypothetical protein
MTMLGNYSEHWKCLLPSHCICHAQYIKYTKAVSLLGMQYRHIAAGFNMVGRKNNVGKSHKQDGGRPSSSKANEPTNSHTGSSNERTRHVIRVQSNKHPPCLMPTH